VPDYLSLEGLQWEQLKIAHGHSLAAPGAELASQVNLN
jgi:hypothetical protein